MLQHDSKRPISSKRWCPAIKRVEHGSQSINIATLVNRNGLDLLWSEIERYAAALPLRPRYSQTKIGEHRYADPAWSGQILLEQDIAGLEVSMDNAVLVSGVDG